MSDEQQRGWWETESSIEMLSRTGPPPQQMQDEAVRISRERGETVAVVEGERDGEYEIRLTGKRLGGRQ